MINLINEYEGSNLLDELREKAARHSGELNLAREKYKENHALELRQFLSHYHEDY